GGFTGWSHGNVLMQDWIDDSPNAQNRSLAALLFPGFNFATADFRIPHWLFVLLSGTLWAVSWPYWSNRFTIRSLLIATTLVAVVLGLIVWLAR
ncbi:MAG TPA: hypothetical protein VH107_14460, partial [Lacipirellulaceae bacterium]|nr:hypothetical protein [Lacipirellulaceae bacterium]